MGNSFEDGQLAGQKLLALIRELGDELLHFSPIPLKQVEALLADVWSRSSKYAPDDVVVGFISQFMTASGYSTDILNMWGADQFLYEQEDCAPVCNLPTNSGIFAFADWTGETDGDAWCYDIKHACVRCIPVGSGYNDPDQSRLESYGVSPNFYQFVAYLRCAAELREWISTR